MSTCGGSQVATLGLFEKRFAGDDSLMGLARLRFQQARMGTEIHAGNPEQLRALLELRPWPEAPVVVHLPRDFDVLEENTRDCIVELASCAAGQVIGCVLHDHSAMVEQPAQYLAAVHHLAERLERISSGPVLFIEYAVGLEPEAFVQFWKRLTDVGRVSPCIDIGHVGIRAARVAYARRHPGHDVCALKAQGPELPRLIGDVQDAVAEGYRAAVEIVTELVPWVRSKRVHFHLHDGHPLSTFSPFGVSDHLSFFSRIPLGFEYEGQKSLSPMFGPQGLVQVLAPALRQIEPERLSLTLEIHPTGDQLPLNNTAGLFDHWRDLSNAERMNHWLEILARNHELLLGVFRGK